MNKIITRGLKKIRDFTKIEGWLSNQEAFGLYYIAKKIKNNSLVVEIGSWKGKSTYCIAKGIKNGKIYAIDPFDASGEDGSKEVYDKQKGSDDLFSQFYQNMSKFGVIKDIVPLIGYSHRFKNIFNEIDFLFIDGDHSIEGCKEDYINFKNKVKKGGYLAFHDYYPERIDLGPTWVIDNLVKKSNEFKFYKQYDSLWIAKRI